MKLPKIEEYLKTNKTLTIPITVFIVFLILLVLWLYFFPGRQPVNNSSSTSDPTKRTTITYQGKEISVPAEVLVISPEDLKLSIAKNDPVKLVQVMGVGDWQKAHLPNSIFIPLDQIKNSPGALKPNGYLVLISKDGKDSALAAKVLIEKFGFSQRSIFSLVGGLDSWLMKGYKVEN